MMTTTTTTKKKKRIVFNEQNYVVVTFCSANRKPQFQRNMLTDERHISSYFTYFAMNKNRYTLHMDITYTQREKERKETEREIKMNTQM